MTLLYREAPGEDWERITASDYENEAELQRLLTRSPDVIPIEDLPEEIGPLVTVAREAELGSGFADLLCVDPAGRIVVIEVKLRKNPEIRREVVAQAVSYAAYIEGMTSDAFIDKIRPWLESEYGSEIASQDLSVAVAELAGIDVDRETFQDGLARSLERGDFLILIAVDEPHPQVRRTVAYLNRHADFSIYLVEVGYYRSPGGLREIISPRILDIQRKQSHRGNVKDFEELMAGADGAKAEVWRRLQGVADEYNLEILEKPTTRVLATAEGAHVISFSPRWGHVDFHLSRMVEAGMNEEAREVRELLSDLAGKPVSKKQPSVQVKALLSSWPRFESEVLPRYIELFMQAITGT